MSKVTLEEITKYAESNIGDFHQKKLENLEKLKLNRILARKNPYLFKAKNILLAQDLVKNLLDAHLSSQEETIFGDFLEGLAIFINSKAYDGRKSAVEGIDLEFERGGTRYIMAIKSGPNWGNSSQIRKMKDDFAKATKVLRTSGSGIRNITAVNGCCYGRLRTEDKGSYIKMCGQRFWSFISGDDRLYQTIIVPLGHRAKEQNDQFQKQYAAVVNGFTAEFSKAFCTNGNINWDKLVKFNSSKFPTQK